MAKLCFGCMQQKENSPICELCGFDERMENQSHQLPIGTILQNQYLVGRVLGQGGFGITYIGWDQHLSIPVAIKEYYPGGVVQRNTRWSTDVMCANGETPELFEKHKTRFLKEARTLAQLSGITEIVQIKSFFPENGTAYIVMEYVEGITLKDHLKRLGRPMTEAEALAIMEPVLKALQKVHDHGLIHRDISPDNIMLPKSGGVKLIDFGTVRYMDDSGKSKSTEAVLKPGFAPMEQYNSRGNLGTWTDVYAICATYHYLLTGKVPADVHDRMEQGESLKLLRSRSGISQKLISSLERGMKLRVQERVQTIAELYQLLYSGKKKPAVPKQQEIKKTVSEKKTKKKGKGGILAACAAAAVAVSAAAMLLIPQNQKPEPSISVPETTGTVPLSTYAPESMIPETAESIKPESIAYAEAERLLANGETARAAITFGKLAGYQDARERSFELWEKVVPRKTVLGSRMAIKKDNTVILRAYQNNQDVSQWKDIIDLAQGLGFYGLKADGTVLAAGENIAGECDVSDWSDIVDIIAVNCGYNVRTSPNGWHGYNQGCTLGLKADGTVLAAGDNNWGQCDVSDWTDIVAIAVDRYPVENITAIYPIAKPYLGFDTAECSDNYYTVGLKADGTVVLAGKPPKNWDLSGWTDIVKINTNGDHMAGLKSDGTVVSTQYDQSELSDWKNITDIDAGPYHLLGLRSDGKVMAVGNNYVYNHLDVDAWTDIVAICANDRATVGLKSDGTVVAVGSLGHDGGPILFDLSKMTDVVAIDVTSYEIIGLRANGTIVIGYGSNLLEPSEFTDIKMPSGIPFNTFPNVPEAILTEENILNPNWKRIVANDPVYRPFESMAQIEYISFLDTLKDAPEKTWDVSENGDGSVLAWAEYSRAVGGYLFHLYIAAEGGVYAPENSFELFADRGAVMDNLETIYFNDAFHTENVIDMSNMFYNCLARYLDVSGFDTSNVTDMSGMFCFLNFYTSTLDISNFDTSKVTDMDMMFWYFRKPENLILGEFETSSVTSWKGFMEEGKTVNGQPWEALFENK